MKANIIAYTCSPKDGSLNRTQINLEVTMSLGDYETFRNLLGRMNVKATFGELAGGLGCAASGQTKNPLP